MSSIALKKHLKFAPMGTPPHPIGARISCKSIEKEGILHEVQIFPCCLQEKWLCSCP